jgi:hypothetical protein
MMPPPEEEAIVDGFLDGGGVQGGAVAEDAGFRGVDNVGRVR